MITYRPRVTLVPPEILEEVRYWVSEPAGTLDIISDTHDDKAKLFRALLEYGVGISFLIAINKQTVP